MRVCPVLDDLGVEYWCDFGTLLGAHRCGAGSSTLAPGSSGLRVPTHTPPTAASRARHRSRRHAATRPA
jgi:hypothetical protein